ncbi:hypothetical protein MKEN_00502200 [Mycena kentingensis (nom. inval.)]|nr:hypothetical protein MKEN_00502200 [Mycena kentingensis (nom. inval.)]
MSTVTRIDDRDGSVAYTGAWDKGGTAREYQGTVSSSLKVGDSFVVSFSGIGIGAYGTVDASSAGVKASYSIDGGQAETVTSAASSDGQNAYDQQFWKSGTLDRGAHTLKVTMLATKPNAGEFEGTIWFDYFNVIRPAAGQSASESASGETTASQTSATAKGKSSSSTASSSAALASASGVDIATAVTEHKKSNTGAIAGAVIGVLLLLLLLAAGFFFWRRRRQQQEKYFPAPSMAPTPNIPPSQPPFMNQTRPTTPMSALPGGALYANSAAASSTNAFDPRMTHAAPTGAPAQGGAYDPYESIGASLFSGTAMSAAPTAYAPSTYAASVTGGSMTSAALSAAALKRRQKEMVDSYEKGVASGSTQHYDAPAPIQHTDSGFRGDSLDVHSRAPAELPPVYTPS